MTADQESELRTIARETYIKTRIGRPNMPDPDSDDGQRRIDRLFDIIAAPFRNGEPPNTFTFNELSKEEVMDKWPGPPVSRPTVCTCEFTSDDLGAPQIKICPSCSDPSQHGAPK